MKIGIISIHSAHNFGSVLQAYALQQILMEYTKEIKIINYRPSYITKEYKLISINYYKKYHKLTEKILRHIYRILTIYFRIIKYNKFEKFIKENLILTKKFRTPNELKQYKFDFDIIICGSDQIWNTNITNGIDGSYFIDFVNKNIIKASYAPSIGIDKIDLKNKEKLKEKINELNYISLRENESIKSIKKYINKKIYSVLDPTFLLDKKEWNKYTIKSNIKLPKKYLLVYMLEYNSNFKNVVIKISNYLKLPIISINNRKYFKNEKLFFSIGPEDFLKLFKNADMVVTNSFHGTAFSIIFEKKICIIPNKSSGMRLIDLANKLGFKEKIINDETELNLFKITKKINYNKINEKLRKEKEISKNYLNEVINK